jgi:glycosyltransferase involved in cell wall biosynthesis
MSKILIIAPLTPPYTGNALPVKYIYDSYKDDNSIEIINLSKGSFKSGFNSFSRIGQILKVILNVFIKQRGKDLIYLTVAESALGNLRDILIYFVAFFNNKKFVIHLLGGNSMKVILSNKISPWFWINKFFIKRLGGVIVEGGFQEEFYKNVIEPSKIHIIPNFAQDFLFCDEKSIREKYLQVNTYRILFLSNLLYGKGHYELFEAFASLPKELQNKIQIEYAGGFESEKEKTKFLNLIDSFPQIKYRGHVSGDQKIELFKSAHIFCLPTYYPYEGQPFVIVEAYAAGCAVITTNHSGIGYIFKDKQNGIEVQKKSVNHLVEVLSHIINHPNSMLDFALFNNKQANEMYTSKAYLIKVSNIFSKILN